MRNFDELWTAVAATNRLPRQAILDLPHVICSHTKRTLASSAMTAAAVAELLNRVIDEINAGSVEHVDTLLNRELQHLQVLK